MHWFLRFSRIKRKCCFPKIWARFKKNEGHRFGKGKASFWKKKTFVLEKEGHLFRKGSASF